MAKLVTHRILRTVLNEADMCWLPPLSMAGEGPIRSLSPSLSPSLSLFLPLSLFLSLSLSLSQSVCVCMCMCVCIDFG